jgi:hypothetical protein
MARFLVGQQIFLSSSTYISLVRSTHSPIKWEEGGAVSLRVEQHVSYADHLNLMLKSRMVMYLCFPIPFLGMLLN